jgi:hypothetical protein
MRHQAYHHHLRQPPREVRLVYCFFSSLIQPVVDGCDKYFQRAHTLLVVRMLASPLNEKMCIYLHKMHVSLRAKYFLSSCKQ